MNKIPAISILMPVYNAELFLREAIESILNQSFSDFEFIIINDGSTDKSKEIIISYNDPRIKYIENEGNIQLIATLNKGINLAKGKYIARMDADDISINERLKHQFDFMESNQDIGLCGTWFETFSNTGNIQIVKYLCDDFDIRIKHLYQIHLSHGTSMIRTDVLRKNNLFFNKEFIHAEDYELWTKISVYSKLANIPRVLYRVRNNEQSVSNVYKEIQTENTKRIIVNQFQKLKQGFSDEDYSLYLTFAYSEFSLFDKQKVKKLDELLTGLLYENEKVVFLPVERLKEYWSEKLFHVCYNVTDCMDIWGKSVFYDKRRMSLLKTIKKYIKRG